MQKREVVVVSGARTAIGDFGGALKDHAPSELAGKLVAEVVRRAGVAPESVAQCVFGNVIHSEPADMYMGRVAALKGGLAEQTASLTVNRLCGSGLQAIVSAAQQIELGVCDTAVAGGAESMSRAPYWLQTARFGQRMGNGETIDAMTAALHCPLEKVHMGVTAENLAEKYGISREEQDALAVDSHRRAQRAIEEGRFQSQILPIELNSRKGPVVFDRDEHVRFDCDLSDMAKLKPVFKREGSVTAGNASGLNDAAAAVLLMAREKAQAEGREVLGRLVDYSVVGVEPKYMGIGPVPAIRDILARNDLAVGDIDLYEVNEAFAAQALSVARELELPVERLNPNGSGIGLGHPIGATGALITVKALYELKRIGGRYAMVSLCIGGGQGIAALFERI
ncbi:beta-ketothiolase BktB [Marinobacterium sp. D7]|uniref:beta-ketothiolase BktB n=1 Tax=Marinobacterium ramblicola TaxID=2849041 RepID=UPI001C2CFE20|nr:beta-ketothiolase BktB [Marinobacterium ramblicola]MBV1790700.1 beta-ketothiolase BktB [Marinobacterium ramblicola]